MRLFFPRSPHRSGRMFSKVLSGIFVSVKEKKKKKTKRKALKITNPNTKHYQNGQNYFNFVSHQYIYSQILFSKISFGVNHG
jgi:hypothetical protein